MLPLARLGPSKPRSLKQKSPIMKYLKISLFLVLAYGFTACHSNRVIAAISIATSIDASQNDPASANDLQLDIEVKDADGIQSVSIAIPTLNSVEVYDNIFKTQWDYTRTLHLDDSSLSGESFITVIVIDQEGNMVEEISKLFIE